MTFSSCAEIPTLLGMGKQDTIWSCVQTWNLRANSFERNAKLTTWSASCTFLCRRPQLVFVARLAETKYRLLLQRTTAEKSIINPKSSLFFKKGKALEKKKSPLLILCGKPSCHCWQFRWERGRLCMTEEKEGRIHHKKLVKGENLQLHFILVKADVWGRGKNLSGSEMGFRRPARKKSTRKNKKAEGVGGCGD